MSHLPTAPAHAPARDVTALHSPSAPSTQPAQNEASAEAPVRSGPQAKVCTPRHLAIVPEGVAATRAAAMAWLDALDAVIDGCDRSGVEQLSVFVCGQDWAASETLLREIRAWLCGHAAALARNGIVCGVIGEPDLATREALRFADRAARENPASQRLRVNLAIGYDGRSELAAAARSLALKSGDLKQHLSTAALPDVDLLIRTGNETRLSHFLLWQTAYAELLFVKTAWPEFTREPLAQALMDFAQRRRTFGGLSKK